MNPDLEKRINRAKELLVTARHATMATVNEDNSPHNTPFRFLYDPELKHVYWGSHPEAMHSKNIKRTGQIFVVVYDIKEKGGLYIRCTNARMVEGQELVRALEIHNSFRKKSGESILDLNYYTGTNPQRMWSAEITNFWVNGAQKDDQGHVYRDTKQEITSRDLL